MLQQSDYLLVIEDSKAETHLLIEAFRMLNFTGKLQFIHSGKKFLSFLQNDPEKHPRAILLDLRLPDIDGVQILQTIKSHEDLKDVPVIIRTGSYDPRDKQKCMELGVVDFMFKSMDFDSIERQVNKLIMHWNNI